MRNPVVSSHSAPIDGNVEGNGTDLAAAQVDEDVVQVAVAQADDVADDGHDGARAAEAQSRLPPLLRRHTAQPQFPAHRNTRSNAGQSERSIRVLHDGHDVSSFQDSSKES